MKLQENVDITNTLDSTEAKINVTQDQIFNVTITVIQQVMRSNEESTESTAI